MGILLVFWHLQKKEMSISDVCLPYYIMFQKIACTTRVSHVEYNVNYYILITNVRTSIKFFLFPQSVNKACRCRRMGRVKGGNVYDIICILSPINRIF